MITIDGKWTMEGLSYNDPRRIKTSSELIDYINEVGFIPLFKNNIEGFSVEELTLPEAWWCGNPIEDPWEWREILAGEGSIAYGKLFCGKAGFISREWFPVFASYRRDGYDFDSRYEDGLVSRRAKNIMDVLEGYESLPSYEVKSLAGFSKEGEKGFESTAASLQMLTYIVVCGFHRKRNKKNQEYGWSVADYTISENLFGGDYVRSSYNIGTKAAKEKIINQLLKRFPDTTVSDAEKLIK